MARLSRLEIQEITRLLAQGEALPERYRDALFFDRHHTLDDGAVVGDPETLASAGYPIESPLHESDRPDSAAAFSLTDFGKFLLNDPRIQRVLSRYLDADQPRSRNEPEGPASKCVTEIIEIVPQILKESGNSEYLLRWQSGATLLKDTQRQLRRHIRERCIRREFEKEKEREEKERERQAKEKECEDKKRAAERDAAEKLLAKHSDTVNTFLAIAERKVSVLDEYGDERLHLLPNLVDDCIAKICGREGESEAYIRAELKKGGIWLLKRHKELFELRKMLSAVFSKYHEEQKGRKKTTEELASLSGVDFETAVGRILMENGWRVSTTATTGDQGADLIASKGARIVVIQAKRYNGAVGNKAVQEVVGAIRFYSGTEGCVVTNSVFTPAARALAQKNNIRLIDGSDFDQIADL